MFSLCRVCHFEPIPFICLTNILLSLTLVCVHLQIVKLEFFKFSVEEGRNCWIDNVAVYDGTNNSAPLLGRFCGHTLPGVVVSSTNSLFVSFQTDRYLTKDGFIIKYMAIHCKYYLSENIHIDI